MSKLIMCPGCDNVIGEDELINNNNICPKCGLNYNNKKLVTDLKKIYLCPKCGDSYSNVEYRNTSGKCTYCDTELVKTDAIWDDYSKIYDADDMKTATRIFTNEYGNFQFSDSAYDDRMRKIKAEKELRKSKQKVNKSKVSSSTVNIPKCPTCGSTNVRKISAVSKAGGMFMFGIFSKTAKSQFECKDCGYKW